MIRKIAAGTALLLAVAVTIAGCTSAPSEPASPPTARTVTTPHTTSSAEATIPPPARAPTTTGSSAHSQAQPAVEAYRAFLRASYAAERAPGQDNTRKLRAHAVDPALGNLEGDLLTFANAGIAYRGTPPASRTRVTKVDLNAKPWPTVKLVDCPTPAPSWKPYYVKTGKPARQAPAVAKPPFGVTGSVIYYEHRWAVYRTTVDRTRTCTP